MAAAVNEMLLVPFARRPALSAEPAPAAITSIPRVHCRDLSPQQFREKYLATNIPVVIEGLTDDWQAAQKWARPDGTVDREYMTRHFGSARVTVSHTARHHEGVGPKEPSTLGEYLKQWDEQDEELPYVRDWHFQAEFPDYQAYTLPPHFAEDWLNGWQDWRRSKDGSSAQKVHSADSSDRKFFSDFRFVYIGPKGTNTSVHADVFRSYSWSSNIVGRKRWRFLAPEFSYLLADKYGDTLAWDFGFERTSGQEEWAEEFERDFFPGLEHARARVMEVITGPGDTIFVPSGYYHMVENLSETISINHNWINTWNVHWLWALIEYEYNMIVNPPPPPVEAGEEEKEEAQEQEHDAEEEPPLTAGEVQQELADSCGFDFSALAEFLNFATKDVEGNFETSGRDHTRLQAACLRGVIDKLMVALKQSGCTAENSAVPTALCEEAKERLAQLEAQLN